MDSKKSNKISDIVRLQRILKKWKKAAVNNNNNNNNNNNAPNKNSSSNGGNKGIKFIKRTLSFTDFSTASCSSSSSSVSNDVVPKGFLAVCVGKELKRYTIPTDYLAHQAFGILLREAEEEFGFQQEGVLKIPCSVSVFEKILKLVEEKKDVHFLHHLDHHQHHINIADKEMNINACCSPECDQQQQQLKPSHHPQMCR